MRSTTYLVASLLASTMVSTFSTIILAGPNEGGTLILHHNASLGYTSDTPNYCGLADLASCTDAVTRVDASGPAVFYALAAFVVGTEPRLSGLTFGINFDDQVQIVDAGSCGDFELADPEWPGTMSGTAVTWGAARTRSLTEVYWFAAYSYVSEPQTFSLIAHPGQGGWFADDSVPSQLDPIAGYGRIGFGVEGSVECPDPLEPGACCFPEGYCGVLLESECPEIFLGENVPCDPNPCAQPGACCYTDGHCEIVPSDLCFGDYLGDATTCDPNPCAQPGACCFLDGHCEYILSHLCNGAFQGEGTFCDPNPCPAPVGACCFADGHCETLTQENCGNAGGFYQGDFTACDPNPCTVLIGACCFDDGHCSLGLDFECNGAGGVYQGNGTTCDPNPCPQPGACCYPDGHCEFVDEASCSGVYRGNGTICEPNPCAQPGACCYPDGHCDLVDEASCSGDYQGNGTICDPNPCPAPTGACCFAGGRCETLPIYLCAEQGGTFSLDIPCDPNPCGACTPTLRQGFSQHSVPPAARDPFRDGARASGPNQGGTLIVHHTSELIYTMDESYCGTSDFTSCENADVRVDGDDVVLLHVFAAFIDGSAPRLAGLTFGIEYDVCVGLAGAGACGDFELPDPSWPVSGSGTAVTWTPPRTSEFVEVYWFAAYSSVTEPQELSLTPHPSQGGWFADDSIPSRLDAIAGFGRMGFATLGDAPCPIPPERGACCSTDGTCALLYQTDCLLSGGSYLGDGTACEPNPCPPPGACCFPDGHCELTLLELCDGDFLGEGTVCFPNPCPMPLGACCFADGHCESLTEQDCANGGGVYQGDATLCDPNPCPAPVGACCFADGHCEVGTNADCAGAGGTYQGDLTTCEPNPCPQYPGACCLDDGSCVIVPEYLCLAQGGSFRGPDTSCDPNPCPQPGACCSFEGTCHLVIPDSCFGEFQGEGTDCDPNPCPQRRACCFSGGECQLLTEPECAAQGGEYHPDQDCSPNPCQGVGACCIGQNCVMLTSGECFASGGVYLGEGVRCEDVLCSVPDCSGGLFTLSELGFEGDLSEQPGDVAASTGAGTATPVQSDPAGGCGTLLFNADGTYENGYAWRYGGTAPPCFGAFAECFLANSPMVCSVVFDFSTTGDLGANMDIYVFNDAAGSPGAVVYAGRVDPGPVAFWPSVSRHTFALNDHVCPDDAFWVGYWGNWPGDVQSWFVGADLDGFGGCPYTNIAPGIGYPTGWNNVSVVWGPTQAIGIGAEITDCGSTPVIDSTWGKIKALFR